MTTANDDSDQMMMMVTIVRPAPTALFHHLASQMCRSTRPPADPNPVVWLSGQHRPDMACIARAARKSRSRFPYPPVRPLVRRRESRTYFLPSACAPPPSIPDLCSVPLGPDAISMGHPVASTPARYSVSIPRRAPPMHQIRMVDSSCQFEALLSMRDACFDVPILPSGPGAMPSERIIGSGFSTRPITRFYRECLRRTSNPRPEAVGTGWPNLEAGWK